MLWSPFDEKGGPAATQVRVHSSGNVVTAAYYHHCVALPLESLQPLVYNALSRVIMQFPGMGAILQQVPFIQIKDGRDQEVEMLVEEQQNMGFSQPSEQEPCWRLVVAYTAEQNYMSDMVACFVVGETARDRFCAVAFHRSFLAALLLVNQTKISKQPSEYPSPIASKRLSGTSISRQARQTNYTQCHSRFKTVTLGAKETARLLADCFASTTLTGVIQAILAASLFANLTSEFCYLRTAGQISPSGTIGNPIAAPCSRYIVTHDRAQGWNVASVWNEAQRIHTASKSELSEKMRKNGLIGLLRHEGDDTKYTRETSGVSAAVSSMGSFQDPKSSVSQEQRQWQTRRVICSNYNTEIGAALWITLVVGGDGCLIMGFSWLEGIIEEVWLDQVIATMRRMIEEPLHADGAMKTRTTIPEPLPWGGSMSRLVCLVRDLMLD
ncbi:hypothetical protein N7517_005920 [Penicillium concentricum]|uniref:Uncharacterized protein n=1 Tax=Penicillium concentricum TaxID=293559 RepID=A0A9W9VAT8_9EURO|nr:uncharacterized protein N7517_005920 [Penicillium concentricum]KAJ5373914.1 hypothetical protein N7517_005920 [Penicillium concentricum]